MSELVKRHILLIYSSSNDPRSLKFCTALRILVLHMYPKFDVDSKDSFLRYGRAIDAAERKKELESYICKQM